MAKSKSLASINDKLLADSTPIQDALRDLLNRKGPVSVLEIECDSGRALSAALRRARAGVVFPNRKPPQRGHFWAGSIIQRERGVGPLCSIIL